jgi:hypothetical protein
MTGRSVGVRVAAWGGSDMPGKGTICLCALACGIGFGVAAARAQAPAPPAGLPPPAPGTVAPAQDMGTFLDGLMHGGLPVRLDAPSACQAGLCPYPPPGPFVELELGILFPHVNNHTEPDQPQSATFPPPGSPLNSPGFPIPTTGLNAAVSPRILIGYRLPNALGDVSIAYRSLAGSSQGTVTDYILGPSQVSTRLNLNQVDLNYGSDEPSLFPWGKMRWEIGARIANLYTDQRVLGPGDPIMSSQSMTAAGIDGALHLAVPVRPNLELYTRGESSFLVGGSTERFRAGLDTLSKNETAAVVTAGVQLGVRWSPELLPGNQLLFGYQYLGWWNLVDVNANSNFYANGIFARWDWRY